jgi:hypothetical protein
MLCSIYSILIGNRKILEDIVVSFINKQKELLACWLFYHLIIPNFLCNIYCACHVFYNFSVLFLSNPILARVLHADCMRGIWPQAMGRKAPRVRNCGIIWDRMANRNGCWKLILFSARSLTWKQKPNVKSVGSSLIHSNNYLKFSSLTSAKDQKVRLRVRGARRSIS